MTSTITKRKDQYSETAIDDEIVVMSLDSGDFFSLTGTAAEIWRHIDGAADRSALIAALAADHGCAPAEVTADIDAFLAKLAAAGLIDGL